jgi:hypothetical protein
VSEQRRSGHVGFAAERQHDLVVTGAGIHAERAGGRLARKKGESSNIPVHLESEDEALPGSRVANATIMSVHGSVSGLISRSIRPESSCCVTTDSGETVHGLWVGVAALCVVAVSSLAVFPPTCGMKCLSQRGRSSARRACEQTRSVSTRSGCTTTSLRSAQTVPFGCWMVEPRSLRLRQ